jgi:hypothetical protein
MTLTESDGRMVLMKLDFQSSGRKPGNAGVGKAARVLRVPDRALPVLRDRNSVLTGLDRITDVDPRQISDGVLQSTRRIPAPTPDGMRFHLLGSRW